MDDYEVARRAFEEQARSAHQSRQLKTLIILFVIWAAGAIALAWVFGMPR